MHAEGISGETPFTFGTVNLHFVWSTSNPAVLGLRSIYHADKVSLAEEKDFSLQLVAKQVGTATLSVAVVSDRLSVFTAPGAVLQASVSFSVLQPLVVHAGAHILVGISCVVFGVFLSLTLMRHMYNSFRLSRSFSSRPHMMGFRRSHFGLFRQVVTALPLIQPPPK